MNLLNLIIGTLVFCTLMLLAGLSADAARRPHSRPARAREPRGEPPRPDWTRLSIRNPRFESPFDAWRVSPRR